MSGKVSDTRSSSMDDIEEANPRHGELCANGKDNFDAATVSSDETAELAEDRKLLQQLTSARKDIKTLRSYLLIAGAVFLLFSAVQLFLSNLVLREAASRRKGGDLVSLNVDADFIERFKSDQESGDLHIGTVEKKQVHAAWSDVKEASVTVRVDVTSQDGSDEHLIVVSTDSLERVQLEDSGVIKYVGIRTVENPNVEYYVSCPPVGNICEVYLLLPEGQRRLDTILLDEDRRGCKPGKSCGCFSGVMTVDVKGKGSKVPMMDLQVGDKILGANNKYQTVYAFGHYHDSVPSQFLKIRSRPEAHPFSSGPSPILEATGNHLIYLANDPVTPVPASSLRVGDRILHSQNGHKDEVVVVDDIATIDSNGFYAPLTTDGTLVVNGILASSYIAFHNSAHLEIEGKRFLPYHKLLHIWTSPVRLACMGMTPKLCKKVGQTYTKDEGLAPATVMAIKLAQFAENKRDHEKMFLLAGVVGTLVPIYVVEQVISTVKSAVINVFCRFTGNKENTHPVPHKRIQKFVKQAIVSPVKASFAVLGRAISPKKKHLLGYASFSLH